jgi:aspartyl-tRNA(Asn)/glutamyl-tRNA(Gln) amidotransferase subunit A
MIDIKNSSIAHIHEQLKSGAFTVRSLVDEYIKNIDEKNSDINAYLGLYDKLDKYIEKAQEMFENGTATELTGIPFAIKDNILVRGEKATGGSKILENYVSTYDATVIAKLKEAGAVLLGRANMDEFAMGGSTENSAYGVTKNPLDLTKVPGGSSGGSAAAVAMFGAQVALGTDTGGSIRQPASFCGLVGLKPTYGAVSRYGAMAMGSSLDQIGVFAKSVADAEIVFKCISGKDPQDATSRESVKKSSTAPNKKIGVPFSFVRRDGVDSEVLENFENTIEKLKTEGYEIVDISLPYLHYSLSVYYILMPAEVSSNLARYDGIRYGISVPAKSGIEVYEKSRAQGFGAEVRRRIMLGTYILSHGYYDSYYNKAVMVREKIKSEFEEAFKEVSFILTPTTPSTAFAIGEKTEDPLAMYLADIFTVPANIAGVPALSLPSGKDSKGLPFGIQITAPHFMENELFTVASDLEKLVQ